MTGRVENYKFSRYAAQFWGSHTKGEAEKSPAIQKAILQLLASENKRNAVLQMEECAKRELSHYFPKGRTSLHISAEKGLTTICNLILNETRTLYSLAVNIEVN
jgi:hypothetical protein